VPDFVLQAAVPKFMQIRLEPASSSTLPASGLGSASQRIVVTNTMHGQKPMVMRLRISYLAGGQPALEQGEVCNFPAGL
jgi:AP-1 complex subunit gamma-1